jgi:hypothetical protein
VSAGNRVDAVHRGRPQHPARSLTSEQVSADAADLRAGIGELAGLVAGSLGLPESLAEVSTFAVHAIPGAEGGDLVAPRPGGQHRGGTPIAPY